jgi:nucleoside-diphosphate-sugar epimerase
MSDSILVTGAAGFVGQHLVERLAAEDHSIKAVDLRRNVPERFEQYVGDNVEYVPGSIINENFVKAEVFRSPNMYDRVFHLAAIVGVNRYMNVENPLHLIDVNINGTKHLLEEVKATDTRFIYTSTSEVYGKNEAIPWTETANQVLGPPTESRWSYSTMKSACEHVLHMFADTDYDLSSTVVRPFNLYGPGQRKQFVISKFIEQVLEGKRPTVYDDGTQRRCFTYIDDFINGLIRASERDHDGTEVYNLGNTEETEIRELARTVMKIAGMDGDPEYVTPESVHDEEFDEPDRRVPDVTRASEELGWEATTELRDGLETTYGWAESVHG